MNFPYIDEKGKFYTPVISKNSIWAKIQTVTHLVEGYIHVRPDDRVKDELDRSETFLAVTNARVYDSFGEIIENIDFISINRSKIVWLIPSERNQEVGEEN